MEDIHRIGGIPAILRYLLNHTDLIDGNQLTITGKTLAENLEDVAELEFEHQNVVRRLENPIKKTGHLTILRGNLAPGTAVAKLTGKEGLRFEVCISTSHRPTAINQAVRGLRSVLTGRCRFPRCRSFDTDWR
jgi:dihydroxyacid dehydratase/phosphogluconate dehydratase